MSSASQRQAALPPKRRKAKRLALGLTLAALLLALGFGLFHFISQENREEVLDSFVMGSYVRQTVWGAQSREPLLDVCARLAELEAHLTWRDFVGEESQRDVANLNHARGKKVEISPETGALLAEAQELAKRSNGAFDPTIGPVSALWSFDDSPSLPEPEAIAQALPLVDWTKLSLDWEEVWTSAPAQDGAHIDGVAKVCTSAQLTDPAMAIDLGAVGKGAACHAAVEEYRQSGVKGAVIAVGGSVGLYGKKPWGQPWKVAVRDPKGEGSMGVLELTGGFVSTSGSYEKYFEEDGRRYHHLLDPRTGYPAESGLVSVTVWCQDSGALSDGLATACFVLGLEDGLALLESYGAQGLFVDESGTVTLTPGLRERFTLTGEGYTIG